MSTQRFVMQIRKSGSHKPFRRVGITHNGRVVMYDGPLGKLLRKTGRLIVLANTRQVDTFRTVCKKRGWEWRTYQPHAPLVLRERAWAAAGTLLGVHEVGGNNTGPGVLSIIHAAGGSGPEPWCGDAVADCYKIAGSKVVTHAWALVSNLGRVTGMHFIPVAELLLGDIVVFVYDHTGLFGWWSNAQGEKVERHAATHFVSREGNTSRVGAMNENVSDSRSGGDVDAQKIHPINVLSRGVRVDR